jgi:putative SOS response-associated peptidase YedK
MTAPEHFKKAFCGMIPPIARTSDIQNYTLNARIETITEKSSFKDSVANRCLIIADGFYEWKEEVVYGKRQKTKHLICTQDGMPFAFAGLYSFSNARYDNTNKKTFKILTTEANDTVASIHSKKRMPVIVKPGDVMMRNGCPGVTLIDLHTLIRRT